jgi:RimJ/RimL family protein N-acetyltransferase
VVLTLRAAGSSDHACYDLWINDRDLNLFQSRVGDRLDTSGHGITANELTGLLEHVERSFSNNPQKPALWQWVVLNTEDIPVGLAELSTVTTGAAPGGISLDTVTFGFVIQKEHQGKGYASSLGQCLIEWIKSTGEVRELQGWCHPGNGASQRTMQKLGMQMKEDAQNVTRAFPLLGAPAMMQVWSLDLTEKQ